MEFKLDFGPWETIFAGTTYGHEVEIASNPESFFIVVIYDKKDGRKVGAVIEGYQAYYAKGNIEAFIQTLPKQCIGIAKNLGDKTSKLFFISFEPFYLDFKEEDYTRKIDVQIRKTLDTAETIVDLARASSIELKELSAAPKADYAPILGDPFILKTLVAGQRTPDLARVEVKGIAETYEEKEAVIQIGLSKAREIIYETTDNLRRTQFIGEGKSVSYALYIFAENFLLEDTPLIIFDSQDYFDGLGAATPDSFSLKEDLVDFEPLGFPMRKLVAKGGVRISLKDTDLFLVTDLLGMNDPEFQKNIALLSVALRVDTPEELIPKILETKELSEYDRLKAERLLAILSKKYPDLFGEALESSELVKMIPGKIARAVLLDTRELLRREKIIFMHSIMRQLTRSAGQTKSTNAVLIIPEAHLLFDHDPDKTTTTLMRLTNRGYGIILGVHEEVPEELEKTLATKMNVVTGKDIAVTIKGKRSYRVILRPSLSGNPKIE